MRAALGLVWAAAACASLGACDLVLGIPDRTLDPHLVCANGSCTCGEGFADCDGMPDNGCEASLQTDTKNCGACGNDCKNGTCKAGACVCDNKHFGDCDGNPANGCETSLDDDSKNCGACGHGCLGAACKAGFCQPVVVGSHKFVNWLQLDGSSLYLGVCEEASPIVVQPVDGGASTPAVSIPGAAAAGDCGFNLSTAGSTLAWFLTDNANAAIIDANPIGKVTAPLTLETGAAPGAFVSTPTLVYWSDATLNQINRVPVTGGTVETIYPAQSAQGTQSIVVDASDVYFTDGAKVLSVPHTGTTVKTITSLEAIYGIAITASTLYLGTAMGMYSVPLSGGKPPQLLTSKGAASWIAVDETGIYFADTGAQTINKMPLTGGQPTVLAAGHVVLNAPIAVDAQAVYFAADNVVYKVAK